MSGKPITIAGVGGVMMHPRIVEYLKVDGQKIKVGVVPRKIKGGFVGMNMEAARAHHIPSNVPYGEIVVWKPWLGHPTKRHEIIEEHLQRYLRMDYLPAHKIALKYEETNLSPRQIVRREGLKKR